MKQKDCESWVQICGIISIRKSIEKAFRQRPGRFFYAQKGGDE